MSIPVIKFRYPECGIQHASTSEHVGFIFAPEKSQSGRVEESNIKIYVDNELAYDGSAGSNRFVHGYSKFVETHYHARNGEVLIAFKKDTGFPISSRVSIRCTYTEDAEENDIGVDPLWFNTCPCTASDADECVQAPTISQLGSLAVFLVITFMTLKSWKPWNGHLMAFVYCLTLLTGILYYFMASWWIESTLFRSLRVLGPLSRFFERVIRFGGALLIAGLPTVAQEVLKFGLANGWVVSDEGGKRMIWAGCLVILYVLFLLWDMVVSKFWGNRVKEGRGIEVGGRYGFLVLDGFCFFAGALFFWSSMLSDYEGGVLASVAAIIQLAALVLFVFKGGGKQVIKLTPR